MRGSHDRIITSHVGSLPRPDGLIEANRKREDGESGDERAFQALLQSAVSDVVRRQKETGIDVPDDGEFGKSMGHAVNYGAWLGYAFKRLSGFQLDNPPVVPPRPANPGDLTSAGFAQRRDWAKFAAAYNDPNSGITIGGRRFVWPVCIGPVKYTGHELIKADIARFKAALKASGVDEGFMTAIAPGEAARVGNAHYKTDDEFVFACADAMREEYKAIIDAGLILQLDDPGIAELWDEFVPEPSVGAYKRFIMVRVDALNQAIKGLPEDRIRFHLCWGSWHGPHVTDLPMRDIIEVLLAIKVNAYSFEAGNVRHEHEWEVWQDVKLPAHKFILPGVVSHATNVVEHPDLVAQRILRFTNIVGRERVIASTDCGLGGRIHPDIAWAKLEALAQGARVASRRLWGLSAKSA
jgi:5-methyltetrahydropteroyltriglutamate--homocysteine methyltransferase